MRKKILLYFYMAIGISIVFTANAHAYTISYEQEVVVDPDFSGQKKIGPMSVKVWMKDGLRRMETAANGIIPRSIIITKEEEIFNYIPEQKIATKTKRQGDLKSPIGNPLEFMDYLAKQNATLKNSEQFDGFLCDIYMFSENTGGITSNYTAWVSREKKFPLKMIITHNRQTIEMHFKNVKINEEIDDSLFEIPDDVKIIDMSSIENISKIMADAANEMNKEGNNGN